ncbi:helix-turn-helix transcriptional regulator [Desulfovibrio sp.]|uniref:helix-turn-helix domain-containing protein n=1 Tax=Desulfovibrio sp. TaxID=885 RepID=UPI002589CC88|nr:helix-turn-helix transcriptional regulator [Desulfovibrio sp.]
MDIIPELAWAVGKVIREAREASGMTQGQLAGFSGLSESYISLLEHGHKKLTVNGLVQIGRVLHVTPAELMRRIDVEMESGPQPSTKKVGRPRKQDKTDE